MSVLTHPRLPHLHHPPSAAPTVPLQRGTDRLQPWSPTGRAAPSRRLTGRTRAALLLAGLAVAGSGAVALAVTTPWDDDAATVQAPATAVGGTTTDAARDDALSRRGTGTGPESVAGSTTDAHRDAVLEQRGQLVRP